MTKREAAERNVKNNYSVDCKECPLADMCAETYGEDRTYADCYAFCKQWLKDNTVDDWQELKIDDLPGDILTGDYELQFFARGGKWLMAGKYIDPKERDVLVKYLIRENTNFRYRKRQPEKKEPSHEEIMTKWWKIEENQIWVRVGSYKNGNYYLTSSIGAYSKSFFIGKESATIPPEEK